MSARAGAIVRRADHRERVDHIKARVGLFDFAQRYTKLAAAAAGEWSGLCPLHKEKSPSFYVIDRPGERFFHCFGCNRHGDVIGLAMGVWGCDFGEAIERLEGESHSWPEPQKKAATVAPARPDGDRKRSRALEIARTSLVIAEGDAVDRYLRGRGLLPPFKQTDGNAGWPWCLRFVPALEYWLPPADEKARAVLLGSFPAMVAVTRAGDGRFLGVHRTWLEIRADGSVGKAPVPKAKKSLGPWRGGAIRLFPAAPHMDFCEGIEDALAARQLSGRPCWPCLSDGGLAAVEFPEILCGARILADRDPPSMDPRKWFPEGVGMHHARQLEARMKAAGVAVECKMPPPGIKDVNALLQSMQGVAS